MNLWLVRHGETTLQVSTRGQLRQTELDRRVVVSGEQRASQKTASPKSGNAIYWPEAELQAQYLAPYLKKSVDKERLAFLLDPRTVPHMRNYANYFMKCFNGEENFLFEDIDTGFYGEGEANIKPILKGLQDERDVVLFARYEEYRPILRGLIQWLDGKNQAYSSARQLFDIIETVDRKENPFPTGAIFRIPVEKKNGGELYFLPEQATIAAAIHSCLWEEKISTEGAENFQVFEYPACSYSGLCHRSRVVETGVYSLNLST